MYCCLELFVHVGPRGAHPAFADRLRGVLVETGTQGPGDHAVGRPDPEQVLAQEESGDPGGRGVAGLRTVDEIGPPLRDLGQDADACPDVLTPLGVVSRQRGQCPRPALRPGHVGGVEVVDRFTECRRVAADLLQADQPGGPVEQAVLDALRGDGAAHLGESAARFVVGGHCRCEQFEGSCQGRQPFSLTCDDRIQSSGEYRVVGAIDAQTRDHRTDRRIEVVVREHLAITGRRGDRPSQAGPFGREGLVEDRQFELSFRGVQPQLVAAITGVLLM